MGRLGAAGGGSAAVSEKKGQDAPVDCAVLRQGQYQPSDSKRFGEKGISGDERKWGILYVAKGQSDTAVRLSGILPDKT